MPWWLRERERERETDRQTERINVSALGQTTNYTVTPIFNLDKDVIISERI